METFLICHLCVVNLSEVKTKDVMFLADVSLLSFCLKFICCDIYLVYFHTFQIRGKISVKLELWL